MTSHRSRRQRAVGARYDEFHALLVRSVHPICFGAFVLLGGAIVLGLLAFAFDALDADGFGIVLGVAVAIGGAVVAAFTFVFTRARAWATITLLLAGLAALRFVDDIKPFVLWAIWWVALLSVAIQVSLLAWVLPRRWRAGLVHLLGPATVGTLLGAVPVALGLRALVAGDDHRALELAQLAFAAALVVVVVLFVLHAYVRRSEQAVLCEFGKRHQLRALHTSDPNEGAPMLAGFIPAWADASTAWVGQLHGRNAAVRSGFTLARAPDVPSLHLTVLGMRLKGSGRDMWVRRRSISHDNLLVGTNHAGVVRFESITLNEGWSVRFAPGTSTLDEFRTVGPQMLELLERALGDAQVCRVGDTVWAWIVGGALSADELDELAGLLHEFGELLEGVDAADRRAAAGSGT